MLCRVNQNEAYEIYLQDRSERGGNGEAQDIRVVRIDADGDRAEIPMRLSLGGWWRHVIKGIGGDLWPPRGEDLENASIKNGRLTFRYSTVFLPNMDGTVSSWEAKYVAEKGVWFVAFDRFL